MKWHAFRCCEADPTVLRVPHIDSALSELLSDEGSRDGLGKALLGGIGGKEQAMFAIGSACKAVASMGESAPALSHLALILAISPDCPFSLQALALAEMRRSNAVLALSFKVASRYLASDAKDAVWRNCLDSCAPANAAAENANNVGKQAVSILAEESPPVADPGTVVTGRDGCEEAKSDPCSLVRLRLVQIAANYVGRLLSNGREVGAAGEASSSRGLLAQVEQVLAEKGDVPFAAAAVLRRLRDSRVKGTLESVLQWNDAEVPGTLCTDSAFRGDSKGLVPRVMERLRAI